MVQDETKLETEPPTTTSTTTQRPPSGNNFGSSNNYENSSPTDTIAAATIAVLAVVIILTLLLVVRAVRKRRRLQRGEQFGDNVMPTISTGVMGSGGAAYVHSVPVHGPVTWETINPSQTDNSHFPQPGHSQELSQQHAFDR